MKGREPVEELEVEAEAVATPQGAATPETEARVESEATGEESRAGLYGTAWRTGLPTVFAIARRELGSYFVSPMAWVVGALVILPVSLFGYLIPVLGQQQATMDNVFSLIAFLYLFLVPLYTMRLIAEERRQGTLEMLLASPVRDSELVIGKWLGGVGFLLATTAFTLVYVILFAVYLPDKIKPFGLSWLQVGNLDWGLLISGYAGLVLAGATFVAIGLLASSLTQNQIIAAVVGVVALLLIWYLGAFAQFIGPPYDQFFDYAGGQNHYQAFSRGQIFLKDALYFASLIAGSLFLATRVIESRRWL